MEIGNRRVALVTGAGGAIGGRICRRLAADGLFVVATDVATEKARITADAIGPERSEAAALDVTDTESVRAAVDGILRRHGRLDVLVNNAGGSAGLRKELTDFKDAREEIWQWVLDLNLGGTMRCTQAVLPSMMERRSGRIISIASIAAEVGICQRCDYSAAKAGIIAFSKALAMEVGSCGITVNCISPGLISRDDSADDADGIRRTTGTWLGRWGKPEELASAVAYLASEEAGFITGANLTVDGGRVLGPKAFV